MGYCEKPTSTPPRTLYNQPLAPPHWGVCAPSFHMSKPSQSRFPQLVHHRGHSHLLSDNLVPNLIAPSVPTHPPQHPHLRDMHFLDMCVLDWPTLRSIQQSRSNYHSVELTFKSRWDFLVTQDSRGKPPFHPSNPNAILQAPPEDIPRYFVIGLFKVNEHHVKVSPPFSIFFYQSAHKMNGFGSRSSRHESKLILRDGHPSSHPHLYHSLPDLHTPASLPRLRIPPTQCKQSSSLPLCLGLPHSTTNLLYGLQSYPLILLRPLKPLP
ncbi:hypothetical protein H5410_030775 [Solanum commersonii]|uniref:Uncharacterized protein n=1 Tax=Solanum commersonii TaxID=4109 RepID=A0A9J5YH67_SOLCO|nr:hypothetical protein H5410_030775 [Solanum commersonii]